MKRLLVIGILLSIPAMIFVNVWQGFRFWEKEREISRLQDEQQQWFEENKLMIVNIAVASSPSRIDELARELELKKADQSQEMSVVIKKGGGNE